MRRMEIFSGEIPYIRLHFKHYSRTRSHPMGYSMSTAIWCLILKWNMVHTSDKITYSNVVTRETGHIALTMVVLCDLEVKAADVLNAYVTAPNHKKIWTVLGPEFGDDADKSAVIVRALDGLNSVDASFWTHLAQCIGNWGIVLVMQAMTCG